MEGIIDYLDVMKINRKCLPRDSLRLVQAHLRQVFKDIVSYTSVAYKCHYPYTLRVQSRLIFRRNRKRWRLSSAQKHRRIGKNKKLVNINVKLLFLILRCIDLY